jgi:hypothetical protein
LAEDWETDAPLPLRRENRDSGTTPQKIYFEQEKPESVETGRLSSTLVKSNPPPSRTGVILKQEWWQFKGRPTQVDNIQGAMMSKNETVLIMFAWAMEIVGVAGGIINSTYTTFGEALPSSLAGYLPAVPMVALAAAELGRVPLASVVYRRHKLMQGVAILGILALGYLAVENWTFGFERIVDLRLKPVNTASRELSRAQADLSALEGHRRQMTTSNGQKRDELRRGIVQRDDSIAGFTAQLSK